MHMLTCKTHDKPSQGKSQWETQLDQSHAKTFAYVCLFLSQEKFTTHSLSRDFHKNEV